MASQEIGQVKSGKGRTFRVYWDGATGDVYVKDFGGVILDGTKRKCPSKARSAGDAMRVAEAFVYKE